MTARRIGSALSGGIRPVRSMFTETHDGTAVTFTCRLCGWFYDEPFATQGLGWAVSVPGLLLLVKHIRGHLLH